ncbi:MAG: phosphotransferase [Candidatus Latescibacteria bacterium]|jgi:aminoglycoside phosphotransferase (APT) family kinase protein|nr:phosphotransferase [Candidatus Latescibacterota bacterium]
MIERFEHSVLKKTIIIPGEALPSIPERTCATFRQNNKYINIEDIRAACTQRLGFSPRNITLLSGGKSASSFFIESEQGRKLVLKMGIFLDHHHPSHEFLFNTAVKSYDSKIPVPETYVLDLSGEILTQPYIIKEWLPGVSVINIVSTGHVSDTDRLFEQIGYAMHLIHNIPVNAAGFGYISNSCIHEFITGRQLPSSLQCVDETFEDRYVSPVDEAATYLFQSSVITKRDYDFIRALLDDSITIDEEFVILHGDMSMGNFLFDKNDLSGVLDGSAMIGFRLEELVNHFIFLHSLEFTIPEFSAKHAFSAFLNGYGSQFESVISGQDFTFLLVLGLVRHVAILVKSKRLKNISDYIVLLRKQLVK